MNEKIVVANIRYSDDQDELRPLMLMNVKYVLRHGCTKKAYYELDYNKLDTDGKKYNYAPLGKEIPDEFFESKTVEYIDSPHYLKAKLSNNI